MPVSGMPSLLVPCTPIFTSPGQQSLNSTGISKKLLVTMHELARGMNESSSKVKSQSAMLSSFFRPCLSRDRRLASRSAKSVVSPVRNWVVFGIDFALNLLPVNLLIPG
jgi:hypothetical protein